MKVIFATPTVERPYDQYLSSLAASVPLIDAAGYEHQTVFEVGCPYISAARARMLGKALKVGFDVIVFIDHDLSWRPRDLLTLIETPGEVVGGTYRFRRQDERYMGLIYVDPEGFPLGRADGAISADRLPAGFLKVTRTAVERFTAAFPELVTHLDNPPSVDLFNHGAFEGQWWGEDYAFSRRWQSIGGECWLVPDLDIGHHDKKGDYPGNFHQFLLRQPGGVQAVA